MEYKISSCFPAASIRKTMGQNHENASAGLWQLLKKSADKNLPALFFTIASTVQVTKLQCNNAEKCCVLVEVVLFIVS